MRTFLKLLLLILLILIACFTFSTIRPWDYLDDFCAPLFGFSVALLVLLVPVLYIWLLVYIYNDARRRGLTKMEALFWIILILFFAQFIGVIIYFIVRPNRRCPYCQGIIRNGYVICPYCQSRLAGPQAVPRVEVGPAKTCPTCQRIVSPEFLICPYCGLKIK